MTSKGQITVPKAIRDALDLKEGASVEFELTEGGVMLRAAPGVLSLFASVEPRNRPEDWKRVRDETMETMTRERVAKLERP